MMRVQRCSFIVVVALALLGGNALAQPEPAPEPEPAPVDTEPAPEPEPEPVPAEPAVPTSELPTPAPEPEPEPAAGAPGLAPAISGHVNGTYNYNFGNPAMDTNVFHSYDAVHNTLMLNAAHVAITGSDGSLGYAVEIDAGTDAFANTLDDDFDIQEAYVTYTGESGFGFKIGKAATYMGIEVIESPANPTISRGFLFGLAEPFTHVGAIATYKASDQIDVAFGVINGWDLPLDNNDWKTFVGKVGVTMDQVALTISGYSGPEQAGNNDDFRTAVDVAGVFKGVDKLDLWFQANVGTEAGAAAGESAMWWGVGVQPVYSMSDEFKLGARAEMFADPDGVRTGTAVDTMLFNISAAPAYSPHEHVWLRAELRVDIGNEEFFADSDGNTSTTQLVGLTEAIVTF